MSDAVFAVEISPASVCVVLGTPGLRGAKIDRVVTRPLPLVAGASAAAGGGNPDAELLARARPVVGALIAELGLRGKGGALVVPDRDVFTRLIQFEFASLRRAELVAAVGGELEGMLPLELDEMVFTFDVLPKLTTAARDPALTEEEAAEGVKSVGGAAAASGASGLRVLAQAMPLADAQGWIEFAETCGFEAVSLLSPLGALAELLPSRGAPATPIALVHLDAQHTEVAVFAGGRLVYGRSIRRGAQDLVADAAGAQVVEASYGVWLRDVLQSLQTTRARLGIAPEALVVTGKVSSPLTHLIGRSLALPVRGPATLTGGEGLPVGASEHAAVVGAALARGRDRAVYELRQGALAMAGSMSFVRAKSGLLAGCAAAILLFAAGAGWASYYKQRKAWTVLSARLKTESTELFGAPKEPRAVIAEAASSIAAAHSPVPKMTAYDIFVKISEQLPPKDKVTLDVSSLEISADKVSLRGSAKTSDEIDLIDTQLKNIECFSEGSRGQTQTGAKGEKTFQLSYKQTCM